MFPRVVRTISRLNKKQRLDFLIRANHNENDKKSFSEVFFKDEVQKLLKQISNIDLEKVFKPRKMGERLKAPKYEFMTDEQLEKSIEKARKRADELLQMPPFVNVKKDEVKILSNDSLLDGHDPDHAKIVFTDISFGLNDEERLIVVREPNGVLRTATQKEKHRLTEVYFPRPGRELEPPEMFQEEHLKNLLDRKEYVFILDRACAQFEPHDPEYHRVTSTAYERINEMSHFSYLHSTRHFGPLAFYLVINYKIDNMLLDNIKSERLEDAVSLVHLYHIVHPDCNSSKSTLGQNGIDVLKGYIEQDSNKKSELELALASVLELQKMKKDVSEGIHQAHGV